MIKTRQATFENIEISIFTNMNPKLFFMNLEYNLNLEPFFCQNTKRLVSNECISLKLNVSFNRRTKKDTVKSEFVAAATNVFDDF